ncbi:hypothetical protein [Natronolimnohabitans innermongolicus]|uniref:Uncharacterized protein n=1 Tax=Natronolimnohabitans innermongolicus JCM 12255 TaxID=1227499 RepID=L9XA75_9EURY|nr:hypothetical protein [Natronolimnohabitans innermongolicus]ELY58351.1 hypothetical protein C493_07239 [Natronolimnohabitans innermongolicus JCM 12255]
MVDHEIKDFVGKCNEASREAKKAGKSSKQLATNFIIMASREFENSPELQEEYETFAEFAIDVEFETWEEHHQIKDALDNVDDLLDK